MHSPTRFFLGKPELSGHMYGAKVDMTIILKCKVYCVRIHGLDFSRLGQDPRADCGHGIK